MPYVKQERREDLRAFVQEYADTPGELNYQLTLLLVDYWTRFPVEQNYQRLNDIIGALEGAKLEFYRRIAAPYEDKKIVENGDVY